MNTPFDAPESIRELARLPRIVKLLRRLPFFDFSALISLFRCITGVSAMGKVIFVPVSCDSGDTKPFLASDFDLLGRPFFRFFSTGIVSVWPRDRVERVALPGGVSASVVLAFARVCRFDPTSGDLGFGSAAPSPPVSRRFFRGLPFLGERCGVAFSAVAVALNSGTAFNDDFAFLDVTRLN